MEPNTGTFFPGYYDLSSLYDSFPYGIISIDEATINSNDYIWLCGNGIPQETSSTYVMKCFNVSSNNISNITRDTTKDITITRNFPKGYNEIIKGSVVVGNRRWVLLMNRVPGNKWGGVLTAYNRDNNMEISNSQLTIRNNGLDYLYYKGGCIERNGNIWTSTGSGLYEGFTVNGDIIQRRSLIDVSTTEVGIRGNFFIDNLLLSVKTVWGTGNNDMILETANV